MSSKTIKVLSNTTLINLFNKRKIEYQSLRLNSLLKSDIKKLDFFVEFQIRAKTKIESNSWGIMIVVKNNHNFIEKIKEDYDHKYNNLSKDSKL